MNFGCTEIVINYGIFSLCVICDHKIIWARYKRSHNNNTSNQHSINAYIPMKKSSSAAASNVAAKYEVDDTVSVLGYASSAVVRYAGCVIGFDPSDIWLGLEFPEKIGKCDGKVRVTKDGVTREQRYFRCPSNCGVFMKASNRSITKLTPSVATITSSMVSEISSKRGIAASPSSPNSADDSDHFERFRLHGSNPTTPSRGGEEFNSLRGGHSRNNIINSEMIEATVTTTSFVGNGERTGDSVDRKPRGDDGLRSRVERCVLSCANVSHFSPHYNRIHHRITYACHQ